jgi:DNA-binding transcriptional ArsR family regulator
LPSREERSRRCTWSPPKDALGRSEFAKNWFLRESGWVTDFLEGQQQNTYDSESQGGCTQLRADPRPWTKRGPARAAFAWDETARDHPARINLIEQLQGGPSAVHALVAAVGGTQQNISEHLLILHQAGIVAREKHGRTVHYRLVDSHVVKVLEKANDSLSYHLAELGRLAQPDKAAQYPPRGK